MVRHLETGGDGQGDFFIDEWAAGNYDQGEFVLFNGKLYHASIATSSTPGTGTDWQLVGGGGGGGGVQFFDSLGGAAWPNPNPGITLLVDTSDDTLVGYTTDGATWTALEGQGPVTISTTTGENPLAGNAQWPDPPEGAVFINRLDGAGWIAEYTAGLLTWEPLPGGGSGTLYVGPTQGLPASGDPNSAGSPYRGGSYAGKTYPAGQFMVTPDAVWQLARDMNDFFHVVTGVDPVSQDVTDVPTMSAHGLKALRIKPVRYIDHFFDDATIMMNDPRFTTAGDWCLQDWNTATKQQVRINIYAGPAYGPPTSNLAWDQVQTLTSTIEFEWDPTLGGTPVPSWIKVYDFDKGHPTINTLTAPGIVPAVAAIINAKVGDLTLNTVDKLWWVYVRDPADPTQFIWLPGGGGSGHGFAGPKDLPSGDPRTDPKYSTGAGFANGEHLVTDTAVWFWNVNNPVLAALYTEPNATMLGHKNSLTGAIRNGEAAFGALLAGRKGSAVGEVLVSLDDLQAHVWDGATWVPGGTYSRAGGWVKEFDISSLPPIGVHQPGELLTIQTGGSLDWASATKQPSVLFGIITATATEPHEYLWAQIDAARLAATPPGSYYMIDHMPADGKIPATGSGLAGQDAAIGDWVVAVDSDQDSTSDVWHLVRHDRTPPISEWAQNTAYTRGDIVLLDMGGRPGRYGAYFAERAIPASNIPPGVPGHNVGWIEIGDGQAASHTDWLGGLSHRFTATHMTGDDPFVLMPETSIQIAKTRAGSQIRVSGTLSWYGGASFNIAELHVGVTDPGIKTPAPSDIHGHYFFNTGSQHNTAGFGGTLSGIPAGTHTLSLYWGTPHGSVSVDNNDFVTFDVWEVG